MNKMDKVNKWCSICLAYHQRMKRGSVRQSHPLNDSPVSFKLLYVIQDRNIIKAKTIR